MSQAVGLRVLDVIKFSFFFFLYKWPAHSTHVEKHTCSTMGVMGLFWATPKVFCNWSEEGEEKRKTMRGGECSAVNSVALCVVSVGQASHQRVHKCVCTCHVRQFSSTHIFLNTMPFSVAFWFREEMKDKQREGGETSTGWQSHQTMMSLCVCVCVCGGGASGEERSVWWAI